ncbi:unnamed protein product, partial [Nesidiocoris tenuis]
MDVHLDAVRSNSSETRCDPDMWPSARAARERKFRNIEEIRISNAIAILILAQRNENIFFCPSGLGLSGSRQLKESGAGLEKSVSFQLHF